MGRLVQLTDLSNDDTFIQTMQILFKYLNLHFSHKINSWTKWDELKMQNLHLNDGLDGRQIYTVQSGTQRYSGLCGFIPSHPMLYEISSRLLNYHQEYCFTYPSFIFDADVSSFLNKTFHCVVTDFASCNMQGSPLIGERNK